VGGVQVQAGSTAVNSVGIMSIGITAGGTATNFAAFSPFTSHTGGTAPSSYAVYYNPSTGVGFGAVNNNAWRAAADYYFLRNDDDAAQCKLGSVRRFHTYNYTSNPTSGSITIDKNLGLVQQITPSAPLIITGFSNIVGSTSDSVNVDEQSDGVTIIIAQNGTPQSVTLPVGSTFKYRGGVNTVGTTPGSVTIIKVTTVRISSIITYMIDVSAEYI
jgi:hypothetical protein